jgi:hypothetical protein
MEREDASTEASMGHVRHDWRTEHEGIDIMAGWFALVRLG